MISEKIELNYDTGKKETVTENIIPNRSMQPNKYRHTSNTVDIFRRCSNILLNVCAKFINKKHTTVLIFYWKPPTPILSAQTR